MFLLRRFILGLLVMAIALSGCSLDQFRTSAAQVPRIVVSSLSDPSTFNPVTNAGANDVLAYIYEGLLTTNGVTGDLEPGIAESWEISDDDLTITFTLREGLQWSDGEPLTIDDVLFSFNDVVFNPKIPSSVQDIMRVGEAGAFPQVRKLDDRRLEVRSPEPFAPLLRFAGGLEILPKHKLQETITSTDSEGNPRFLAVLGTDTPLDQVVVSGPYRIVSYLPSQRIILERNPYYWRRDAAGNPQPYIQQVVMQIIQEDAASLTQFRSGSLDVEGITPDYFRLLKREEERGNFTIYEGGPALTTSFITFNLNQATRNGRPLVDPVKSRWFNTLEFRQAVAHAIDRQTMINNIYQGLGQPQNSQMYVQSPFYLSPEEGLPVYDYNLDKARELLTSAGFKRNSAGQLTDAEGNRVRFTLITNAENPTRAALGAQIKRDLGELGMQVDFEPIAFNTLIRRADDTLDWEAMILGIGGAPFEPDGGKNTWSPDGRLHMFNQSPGQGQEPIEGRVVADWEREIYRLYVQAGQEFDPAKRKELYGEAQKIAQQNLPFIYLVNPLALVAVRNKIQGIKYSAAGGPIWNLYELQLVEGERIEG
ncbi:ABC transporter substrate-binding protein [Oscillatoria sp. FACHB-1407]|uniref:ABC transporter substrate-binding protein n=1 Tax=Oscillatoria sp. FACHB-1407 TaxID=2692847 RepID=UPI001689794C|nr:ABC transporter substrate-binding protein [Oscillatoria sp. FACHB-1407]MBD2464317.1 ABC transporter substrate-binding protein [Oscillatoria sp. FACHB-1407]